MINAAVVRAVGRRSRVGAIVVAAVAVVVTFAISILGPAQALASRAVHASNGKGGYLAEPTRFRSATVYLRVPRIECPKTGTPYARFGLFLHTADQDPRDTTPWFAGVTVVCHSGRSSAYEAWGDVTATERHRVHTHDLVRVHAAGNASPYLTVHDLTSHTRIDGGAAAPPGQHVQPTLVIGGFRRGVSIGKLAVGMTHAVVNGKALGTVPHHHKQQHSGNLTIVSATPIHDRGSAFDLKIS